MSLKCLRQSVLPASWSSLCTAPGISQVPCRQARRRDARARAAAPETAGRVADETYMQEYRQLKEDLLSNTRKSGGVIATYLLLTVDGGAAICALAGSLFSNLYLMWLFKDVDEVQPGDRVPMFEAEEIENSLLRSLAKVGAGYQAAFRPRLLVPIALALLMTVFNRLSDTPLDLTHEGCLLFGFLSYKIALIMKIAADNAPKGYRSEEMSRPIIEKFDDELDQWGRPKKQLVPLPTDVLPENVDTSKLPAVDLEKMSVLDVMATLKPGAPQMSGNSSSDGSGAQKQ